ncbi:MAG: transcription termination factor NusA [Blastocatellia bacterium]
MSTSPISQTIDILSREKGIEPQVIISAIEEAVVKAARKQFNADETGEELRARYDLETGDIDLFALMTVVEEVQYPTTEISLADVEEMGIEGAEVGDQLEFPKPKEELGRIAAQTAKQIIFQKVREAERKNVYDEYISRVGELVHGFVKRFEGGRIITDLGKIEALLPKTQQSRAESFSQGERIRIVINDVLTDSKGPQVEVSRTSPELLKRLFEMEVPEIYDGTVQIKAAVREPGDRAKIAVISTERDVDPVGACVGMKGSRVQAIIRELRGERIDIIEWSEDPAVFAANALSPAKVSKVEINSFEEKKLTVTVPEDQLSLAIGKKGQNVRLAAKLVGWHIDIRSAEEAARAAAAQLEAVMAGGEATLTDIRESLALDQITAQRLKDRGIETIDELTTISVDELVDTIDVSFDQANEILDRAHRLLAQKHAREVREAHTAEENAAEENAATDEVSEATSSDVEAADVEAASGAGLEEYEEIESQTAAADEIDQEEQFAPPPDAEPEPARPLASAVPDFGAMSPSEVQIQELLADEAPTSDEAQGPMPASGLEAFAPGEKIIPESHSEWAEKAGIEQSEEQTAEELVASFNEDLAAEAAAGEGSGPSEAAEEETGQETTDELSPEIFESSEAETGDTDSGEKKES